MVFILFSINLQARRFIIRYLKTILIWLELVYHLVKRSYQQRS